MAQPIKIYDKSSRGARDGAAKRIGDKSSQRAQPKEFATNRRKGRAMAQPRESATNAVGHNGAAGNKGMGNKKSRRLVQQRVWQKRGGGSALESAQRMAGTMGEAGTGMKDESASMEHHISTIVAGYREERENGGELSRSGEIVSYCFRN